MSKSCDILHLGMGDWGYIYFFPRTGVCRPYGIYVWGIMGYHGDIVFIYVCAHIVQRM